MQEFRVKFQNLSIRYPYIDEYYSEAFELYMTFSYNPYTGCYGYNKKVAEEYKKSLRELNQLVDEHIVTREEYINYNYCYNMYIPNGVMCGSKFKIDNFKDFWITIDGILTYISLLYERKYNHKIKYRALFG